jgi:hypothetical protein
MGGSGDCRERQRKTKENSFRVAVPRFEPTVSPIWSTNTDHSAATFRKHDYKMKYLKETQVFLNKHCCYAI